MSNELEDAATLMYETGTRMQVDVMKSAALPRDNRIFLNSWGRRLQEQAQWVFAQGEANVLGTADILALVRLEMEIARSYRERTPSSV